MKKSIITLVLAMMAMVGAQAQTIAVVTSDGLTSTYNTLQKAIEGATDGSVIYLPGGGFPIADSVKITKKLSIIGIGHKVKGENVDGYTTIQGNLFFDKGSDYSSVMGTYITGAVYIGNDGNEVDNVLVRYCNIDRMRVQNNKCLGTVVNQNYIRSESFFNAASVEFTNNICHSINNLDNGVINYNIFTSTSWYSGDGASRAIHYTDNSAIKYNVFLSWLDGPHSGSNCLAYGNMGMGNWGNDPINLNGAKWTDVFKNSAGITPASNYHFTEDYQDYEGIYGIYGGTGFSDTALPPVPYIISKQIPEQTDAQGKLNIQIRVRAGE